MSDSAPKSLDELMAELPRELVPPRQVWQNVVAGIARGQQRSRAMALALAASIACVMLASALVWAVMRGAPAVRAPPSLAARGPNFAEPVDARYTATRAMLEATFRERLALLDPATRTQIEASLTVIQHAHEDIRKALVAEPANPLLEQLFESTWHEEFDLYDRVVSATQPTLARI